MDEELLRLVLEVTGSNSVAEATRALKELKQASVEQAGTYEVLARHTKEYELATDHVTAAEEAAVRKAIEETQARRAMNEILEDSAVKTQQLTVAANGLGTAVGDRSGLGRGVLQASYAVQDFTSVLSGGGGLARALSSVQNNIPLLLTSLGVGAGLAGTVSLVSVSMAAAAPIVGSFFGAMDSESAKKAADETKKLADQVERLKNLQTTPQKKTTSSVEDYLRELPASTVLQGLLAAGESEFRKSITDREQAILLSPDLNSTEYLNTAQSIDKRRQDAKAEANRVFGTLTTDRSSRERAANIARMYPGNFPAGFSRRILEHEPEAMKARAEQIKDIERQQAESNRDVDAMLAQRAESAMLTKEGAGNEAAWRRQMEANQEAARREKERLNLEGQRNADIMRRQMETEQRAQEREAERARLQAEREADPLFQASKLAQEERRAVTQAAMAMNQQQHFAGSQDQLNSVIREAVNQLPMTGGDVSAAIVRAVQAGYMRAMQQQQRDMMRLQAFSESRLP